MYKSATKTVTITTYIVLYVHDLRNSIVVCILGSIIILDCTFIVHVGVDTCTCMYNVLT